jgi:hypothetical protein
MENVNPHNKKYLEACTMKKFDNVLIMLVLLVAVPFFTLCMEESAFAGNIDEKTTAALDRVSGGAERVITAVPGETKIEPSSKHMKKLIKPGYCVLQQKVFSAKMELWRLNVKVTGAHL